MKVDPLDGTTNFVHGFPFVCVSIALVVEKKVVVGVVYNPILDELFLAIRGEGATLNGTAITTSGERELGNALLATEIGVRRDESVMNATYGRLKELTQHVRSVRFPSQPQGQGQVHGL